MGLEVLTEELFRGRKEARGITIDGPYSLDLDDAIWLEKTDSGYIAHISIADVGAIVKPWTDIDRAALSQGFTHYRARGNYPMLPRELSEDALSLHEGKKRLTITISIPLDNNLTIGEPTIGRTFLVNAKKLSYGLAEQLIANGEGYFLRDAYALARALFEKRKDDGALLFFDKERGLATSEEGHIITLNSYERYNTQLLIQEFMILANKVIADYFASRDIPCLFRNHTARASAPARNELLRDIETAVLVGNPSRIETMRQRLNLVLERATYAPTLSGHYALNLAAYMHFTSPIRRYADLVNNRQLSAALQGEILPYTRSDLTAIAEQLNELQNAAKDGKDDHFRQKALHTARRRISAPNLAALDQTDFYLIIKVAAAESRMNEELEAEINSRLDASQLKARDVYTILLESRKEDAAWQRIRERTIKWIEANPNEAISIIFMGTQSLGWSQPQYTTTSVGDDHTLIFTSVGTMSVGDKVYTSVMQTASSRKTAEQLAAVSILEKILGMVSSSINLGGNNIHLIPEIPEEKAAHNYIGLLMERCQQEHWQKPTYEISKIGPDHTPSFKGIAKVVINGTAYYSDTVEAATKKQAQQLAAASLVEKLPYATPYKTTEPYRKQGEPAPVKPQAQTTSADGVFISKLVGILAQKGKGMPSYEISPDDKGFECQCTVPYPDGSDVTFTAIGRNKDEAKRNAAKEAYEVLKLLYRKD